MAEHHKKALAGSLMTLLIASFILYEFRARQPTALEWISLGIGIVLSIPACRSLRRFLHAHPNADQPPASKMHYALPIAVVGGPLLSFILKLVIGVDLTRLVALAIGASLCIFFVYITVQVGQQQASK